MSDMYGLSNLRLKLCIQNLKAPYLRSQLASTTLRKLRISALTRGVQDAALMLDNNAPLHPIASLDKISYSV